MSMVTLGSKAPGDIVTLNESGAPVEFYVAAQDYESDLNGAGRTLLVRKDIYDSRQWNTTQMNTYATSAMDEWLNGDYQALLDSEIRSVIGSTKFYYTPQGEDSAVTTLERAIFLLSGTELGGSQTWLNVEGTALPAASVLNIAELNGKATNFWTRSPYVGTTFTVALMTYGGTIGHNDCRYDQGARPAFTLPGATTFVDDSGAIVFNDPPPTPTLTPPTDCIWGVPATATCTAVEDPDGDTVAYEWGMSYDKEAWQTLASDTESCTYTAFGDHYLRVRAVDEVGNASDYAQSALITVQRWSSQIIYGGGA